MKCKKKGSSSTTASAVTSSICSKVTEVESPQGSVIDQIIRHELYDGQEQPFGKLGDLKNSLRRYGCDNEDNMFELICYIPCKRNVSRYRHMKQSLPNTFYEAQQG